MITRKQYLRALRSGEFIQGTERLRTNASEYCCLGLYCELASPDEWLDDEMPYNKYAESGNAIDNRYALRDFGNTLGLSEDTSLRTLFRVTTHMIHMNDGIGDFEGNPHTFEQIADWIENDLHAFVEEAFGAVSV